jgi:hypothetical protein
MVWTGGDARQLFLAQWLVIGDGWSSLLASHTASHSRHRCGGRAMAVRGPSTQTFHFRWGYNHDISPQVERGKRE